MKSDVPLAITLPAWEGVSPLSNERVHKRWRAMWVGSWVPALWLLVWLFVQDSSSELRDGMLFYPTTDEQFDNRVGILTLLAVALPVIISITGRVLRTNHTSLRLTSRGLRFEGKDGPSRTVRLSNISRIAVRLGEVAGGEFEEDEVSLAPDHVSDILVYFNNPQKQPLHISFQARTGREKRLVLSILRQWQAHGVVLERATEHAGVAYDG